MLLEYHTCKNLEGMKQKRWASNRRFIIKMDQIFKYNIPNIMY